jgi:transglutaminase-like putative cysteine protease
MGASQAIEKIHWRLLWPTKRALQYRNLNTTAAPAMQSLGDETEYTWQLERVAAIEYEDYTPSWFRQIPTVQLGEFSTSEDVVNWALPLYSLKGPLGPSLRSQIESWKSEPDPEKRMLAALRFVQDDVRYMGIELGPYSHTPTQPSAVFDRRFGDCKDKSLLLTTLLTSLGMEAYPALVNTSAQNTLDQWQPSPFAFDHVIVRAALDGKIYWIDATLSLQRGGLAQRYNHGYRRALVLRNGNRDLEEIPQDVSDEPTTEMREVYKVEDYQAPALLEVVTTYRNIDADQMRSWIAQQTLSELGKSYLNYYAEIDAAIEANGALQVSDDPSTNALVITERYKIPSFWKNKERQFFAGRIYEELGKPGISKRSTPLAVSYPARVRQTIVAHLPQPYAIKDSGTIASDAFFFRYQYGSSGNTITLDYQLRTLRDHVPADRVAKHLETVARIRTSLSYEISKGDFRLATNIVKLIPFLLLLALAFSALLVFVVVKLVKRGRSGGQRSDFKQRNRFGAGQAPETAIQLDQMENMNQNLRSLRCSCGAVYHDNEGLPETESAIFNGKRLTVVRLKCDACTRFQDIYFTFPGAATGSPG